MTRTIICAFVALPLILVFLHSCQAQYNPFPPPQARNSIPDMITGCYSNFSAYNRFTRRPMHIDNLISIIRKIEDKTDQQWDARRIARTLVHRYMYDGMKFYGEAKPDFRYRQEPYENAKSLIVKELIPISDEEIFPDGLLDNDEKCSLHWMLSHAMNSSMREEEMFPGYNQGSGFPGSNPFNPNNNNNNGFNNNNNNGFNNNNNNGFNNNNNNGFNNNNNGYNPNSGSVSNTGGSNYYRGRRDVSEATKGNQTFDFSKATNDSMENDNVAYEQDDYDVAENKTSAADPKSKSSEEKKDDEVDDVVDVLLSDATGTGASKSARQVSQQDNYKQKTKRPVETGVVYTKWGGIAAGRLLSGIAAGLQLTQMSVYSGVVTPVQGSTGGTNPWSSGSGTGNGFGNNGNNGNNGFGNNGNNGFGNNNGNNGYGGSGSGYGSYAPSKSINPNNNNNGYPYQSQPQQPQQPPAGQRWSGRKKRQVQNLQPLESLYAVTLSGDAGQAAILNAPNEIRSNGLPTGAFNDTVCPREYILSSLDQYGTGDFYKPSSTWTYLTEAEVRGGLDGFILGANIRRWDPSSTLRLSDILQEYYSERGISTETNFRACDRSSLMNQYVDRSKLSEQTRSFAYLYNNRTSVISEQKFTTNPTLFENIVNEAQQRMETAASSFNSIGPCQSGIGNDFNDNQKNTIPKLTIYGVLDHSATILELDEQKRFLGQLAYEINVSPAGSRLGVVDGSSGNIMISPNWTDSSSTLACRVSQIISQTRNQNFNSVFSNLKTDLERMKNEELRNNHTRPNGIVIILFVQGRRLDESQITDIVRLTREINAEVYDVSVITTSTKYSESDMGFDEGDYQIRHIQLPQNQGNFSDLAGEFVKSLVKTTHSAFRYIQCDPELYPNERDQEHLIPTHFFLDPNTIDYYRISPDYFFRARALVLRFTSDNGKVRVCYSRKEWYPNSNNADSGNVHCEETTGNYKPIGSSEVDVQFKGGNLNKPCGKNGKRSGCDPIFISITPIELRGPGQTGLDCSIEGCQSSNQVKVTFTHWDMKCDGVRSVLSSTVAFITLSLALLNWLKST